MALITAAQFREHYPRLTGSAQDSKILDYIAGADDLMAAYCGFPQYDGGGGKRSLTLQTYTLYLDGPSPQVSTLLCLCVRPLGSVTSVKLDAAGAFLGSESTLVANTDYVVVTVDGTILRIGANWPVAYSGIKVVTTAGYSTTPNGLIEICSAAVRHLWDRQDIQGLQSFSAGGSSATYTDVELLLPAAVKDALEPYRVCAAPAKAAA